MTTQTDPTPAEARARECAAQVFDRLARKAAHPDVTMLNRSYAARIRAGEGDDFDAVQSALLALTPSTDARSRGHAEERECDHFDPDAFAGEVLRIMDGRSCRDVAPEIGISHATLNRVTRGNTPDLPTYFALCRWLRIPPSLRDFERPSFAALHRLQHSGTAAAKPKLGGSIIQWAADEIAAIRSGETPVGEGREQDVRRAVARCIEIVRETGESFRSEEYATSQPIGSMQERFACSQCVDAIEREYGMGTNEQRQLLGKPSMAEEYRAAFPTPPAAEARP